MKFKAGDKVRLNPETMSVYTKIKLRQDEIYTIKKVMGSYIYLEESMPENKFSDFSFEIVNKKVETEKEVNKQVEFKVGDVVRLNKNASSIAIKLLSSYEKLVVEEILAGNPVFQGITGYFNKKYFTLVERNVGQVGKYPEITIDYSKRPGRPKELGNNTKFLFAKETNFVEKPNSTEVMLILEEGKLNKNNEMIKRDEIIQGEKYTFGIPSYFYPSIEKELNKILKKPEEWDLNKREPSFLDILDVTENSARFGGTNYVYPDTCMKKLNFKK